MIRTLRRWWYRGKRDRRKVAGVPPMPEEFYVSHNGMDRIRFVSWHEGNSCGTVYKDFEPIEQIFERRRK